MSRFSAIATKGALHPQTHAPEAIPRNRSRLLLTCRTAIPHNSGLLIRLARNHTNEDQHHDRKAGVSTQIVILSHWCPRQSMDRPRPTVHIPGLPKVCETMGLRTRYLITKVSSKQRKGRSYSKVHEKDHPISMAWTVPRREQVGPSATAIPKHPITQRRTRSSPKIVWTTNTRHPAGP